MRQYIIIPLNKAWSEEARAAAAAARGKSTRIKTHATRDTGLEGSHLNRSGFIKTDKLSHPTTLARAREYNTARSKFLKARTTMLDVVQGRNTDMSREDAGKAYKVARTQHDNAAAYFRISRQPMTKGMIVQTVSLDQAWKLWTSGGGIPMQALRKAGWSDEARAAALAARLAKNEGLSPADVKKAQEYAKVYAKEAPKVKYHPENQTNAYIAQRAVNAVKAENDMQRMQGAGKVPRGTAAPFAPSGEGSDFKSNPDHGGPFPNTDVEAHPGYDKASYLDEAGKAGWDHVQSGDVIQMGPDEGTVGFPDKGSADRTDVNGDPVDPGKVYDHDWNDTGDYYPMTGPADIREHMANYYDDARREGWLPKNPKEFAGNFG